MLQEQCPFTQLNDLLPRVGHKKDGCPLALKFLEPRKALTLELLIANSERVEVLVRGTGKPGSVTVLQNLPYDRYSIHTRPTEWDKVHDLLTGVADTPADELGKLAALAGVREYPTRVKCARLGWHALKSALAGRDAAPVSTE